MQYVIFTGVLTWSFSLIIIIIIIIIFIIISDFYHGWNSASDVCLYECVSVCVCGFVEEGNMTFPHFSFPPTRRHCKLYQKIIDFFSVLVLLSPLAETAQRRRSHKHIFNTYSFVSCFKILVLSFFFFFLFF